MSKSISNVYLDLYRKSRCDLRVRIYHCQSLSFLFCVQGGAKISYSGLEYVISQNTIMALFPDVEIKELEIEKPFEYIYIVIKQPLLSYIPVVGFSDMMLAFTRQPFVVIADTEREHFMNMFSFLFDVSAVNIEKNKHCIASIIASLTYYLHSIYSSKQLLVLHSFDKLGTPQKLVKKCIALIRQYSKTQRFVSFYAKQLHVSTIVLNNAFHQVLGCSVSTVIHQSILSLSKTRLVTSADSISVISYDMGFKSPSNFVSFFKKYAHESPQSYRSHCQKS